MLPFNEVKKDTRNVNHKIYFKTWKGFNAVTVLDNANEEIVFYIADDEYWYITVPLGRFLDLKYSEYVTMIEESWGRRKRYEKENIHHHKTV